MTSVLSIWQVLSPADLDKIAASDSRALMVYGVYGLFITLSGAIVALYKAYRDEVRENRIAADQRLSLFTAEVDANKKQNAEMVKVLLEFSQSMADHLDSLKALTPLIERHERETKEGRSAHEARVEAMMKSILETLSKR